MFSTYRAQDAPNWKPILAGFVGGAIGTFAMGYYWRAVTKISGLNPREQVRKEAGTVDKLSVVAQQTQGDEGSTAEVGRVGYEMVTDEKLSEETQEKLGRNIHWLFGAVAGALYGGLRARNGHGVDLRGAAAHGTLVWLLGSEVGMPLLGVSAGPTHFPMRQHVHNLGAHLAYGATTALIAQQLAHQLDRIDP